MRCLGRPLRSSLKVAHLVRLADSTHGGGWLSCDTSAPLIYALQRKTQVLALDIILPENHNGPFSLFRTPNEAPSIPNSFS